MKVLFVLENYLPTKNGGIENYTQWLASLLFADGKKVEVAYLSVGEADIYMYEGVKVHKLVQGINSFEQLLTREQFDVCHFQEYSGSKGINLDWFKIATQHCKKVFFTFHLPYLTCYKGDFRYKGQEDCNDFSSVKRCVKCILTEKFESGLGAQLTISANGMLKILKVPTPISKLEDRIHQKKETLDQLLSISSNVFIYANWFKRILEKNGYANETIKLIPYKSKTVTEKGTANQEKKTIKNKIVFIGRIEPPKGLHILCKAMNALRDIDIELDVYGNIVDEEYFNKCTGIFPFNFKKTVTRIELLKIFGDYDFLILPSAFTEMNSLVVKDAFYEGLPSIVSSAKGNLEAVREGQTGFIFEYGDAADLARVIRHAYQLLYNGWEGDFSYEDNSEKDLEEILSYYRF